MRHNIYNQVHRPLKLAMLSTSLQMNTVDLDDSKSVSAIINKVEEVIHSFYQLLQHEHTYILPLVFDFEPSIWNVYTTEHQAGRNLCRRMEELISAFRVKQDKAKKLALMKSIKESFTWFMTFNLTHMSDEEEVLNEILWRYYSDPVLLEIEQAINYSSAPRMAA